MIKRFFSPKAEISKPMEVTHALHLDHDLQWQFDPKYDAKEVFRKLQVIGKGGFGTVCKVLHIPSNKILAGKLVNPNLVDDPNTRNELEHEIQLMHEVDSNYTVHYYGSVQFEGSMMILMEYCDCGSLRDILDAREQVLSEDQISIVMHDLLQGLLLIHTRYRIVHRDIKAANILLTSSGEIRIADFGVSRRFEKTGTIHTMTIVGTPYWMAPEVINGVAYSFPADLWSVGITAVELSEGAPPYVELAPTKAMIEIAMKGFPGYRFKKMHSPEYMDFVSYCVKTDVNERWGIQELLEHPFIKRAERMPRLEVLADLIRCGPKATSAQGNSSMNSSMMSFSTGQAINSQDLQRANQIPMNGGDTYGSIQMPFSQDGSSTGGFDSFSTNGFNSNSFDTNNMNNMMQRRNLGMNNTGSNLNSATNFDTFGSQNQMMTNSSQLSTAKGFGTTGFDSAALNSATNFDTFGSRNGTNNVMLSSANNFDSFAMGGGQNGFDSAALQSGTSFDSFMNNNNGSILGQGLRSAANFDSFNSQMLQQRQNQNNNAMMSTAGFDSFATNGFNSVNLNSASNFDSFNSAAAGNSMSYDSFSSNSQNSTNSSGFDSFASNSSSFDQNAKQMQQKGNLPNSINGQSAGFDSFASTNGANLASATGFDSFAQNMRNSAISSGAGFDSFKTNGFDSFALQSGSNFDSFASAKGADLKSSTGFDSFQQSQQINQQQQQQQVKNNSCNIPSANGFDSFAAARGADLSSATGFDSFKTNGFDSVNLNSASGFDSFALQPGSNFDSFASTKGADLKSSTGFDTFQQNQQQQQIKNNNCNIPSANGFDSFAAARGADLSSATGFDSFKTNGFDSFALQSGSSFDSFASAKGADLKSSTGFDSFQQSQQLNQQQQQQQQQVRNNNCNIPSANGFDSFAAARGADLSSATGFDSFKTNGFDSVNLNSASGFDSFATNGFDSVNLNSATGFDSFSGGALADGLKSAAGTNGFQKMGESFDSGTFQSFDSFVSHQQSPIVPQQQQQLQQQQMQQMQQQQLMQQQQMQQMNRPQAMPQKPPLPPSAKPLGKPPLPPSQRKPSFSLSQQQQLQQQAMQAGQQDESQQQQQQQLQQQQGSHVSFEEMPDNVFRQVSRANSVKIPFVAFRIGQQSGARAPNQPEQKVIYQKDEEKPKEKTSEEEEDLLKFDEPPTLKINPFVALIFFLIALALGLEGFVTIGTFAVIGVFALSYGKEKSSGRNGLISK